MFGVEEKYTIARGPSEVVLNCCYRKWVESNAPISFVTEREHFVVEVTSITRPCHEEDPWFIAGRLPNKQTVYIKYYARDRGEDGERVSGIAYFWLDPNDF